MPYLSPSPSSTSNGPQEPVDDSSPRPTHRRTRSAAPTFSDEKGQGAFTPLANIPRRQRQFEKRTLFQIAPDDDDDAEGPVPEKAEPTVAPASSSPPKAEATPKEPRIEVYDAPTPPETNVIPFPSSSEGPAESSLPFPSFAPPSSRSTSISKSSSSPIVLANGKKLKPSLKSSMSSPQIAELPGQHMRSRSEPSTPMVPKTVHFPERKDNLESVIMFEKTARPRAISGQADDTETETEGYDSPANAAILAASGKGNSFPFPSSPSSDQFGLEIDQTQSSTIPVREPSPFANVIVETLVFPRTRPPTLRGSILVKNIAFEKGVALRFTLDNWQTTSEVVCRHVCSLPTLPSPFPPERLAPGAPQLTWDRFSFLVRLEDVERKLAERTIYFVARFQASGVGEWWDNNNGNNYKVVFKKVSGSAPSPSPSTTTTNKSPSPLRFSGDGPSRMFPGLDLRPSTLSLPSSDPSIPPLKLKKPFGIGGTSSPIKSSPAPPATSHVSPPAAPPAPFGSVTTDGFHQRSASSSSLASSASSGSLRLSNYAAPMSPISPSGTSSPNRQSLSVVMGPIIGGQPVSLPPLPSPNVPKTVSLSPNASTIDVRRNSPNGSPTRPLSMLSASTPTTLGGPITPASPLPISHLEGNPDDRTPPANGLTGSRNNSNSSFPFSHAKDSSYAALLEKWCFHQSPPPGNSLGGVSLSTSPSTDTSIPGLDAGIKGSLHTFARPGTNNGASKPGQFESSANGYGSVYSYGHRPNVLNKPVSLNP